MQMLSCLLSSSANPASTFGVYASLIEGFDHMLMIDLAIDLQQLYGQKASQSVFDSCAPSHFFVVLIKSFRRWNCGGNF